MFVAAIHYFIARLSQTGFIILLFQLTFFNTTGTAFAQQAIETTPDQMTLSQLSPRPLSYAIDTSNVTAEFDSNGESQPVVTGINFQQYDSPFKTQTIETTIEPRQQVEYMVNMDQGNVLLFTWEIDGRIYHDLHGHQENVDPDIWIQYTEGRENTNHGNFTAAYTGEHGWYWVNLESRPVKLTLTISGFYKNIFRIDL
ncbi:MAG: hypothetical protein HKN08_08050 [Gammaproteobacteria bacterium]|nr:hypothetical protein [Gammaproteobacteria bacterium]